jgi:hypothetical protein
VSDRSSFAVIASDSEAIQTKPQLETPRLDRFALLAMTESALEDPIGANARPGTQPYLRSCVG